MGHGLPYPTIRTANVKKSVHFQNALQKGIRFYRAFSCFRRRVGIASNLRIRPFKMVGCHINMKHLKAPPQLAVFIHSRVC